MMANFLFSDLPDLVKEDAGVSTRSTLQRFLSNPDFPFQEYPPDATNHVESPLGNSMGLSWES